MFEVWKIDRVTQKWELIKECYTQQIAMSVAKNYPFQRGCNFVVRRAQG